MHRATLLTLVALAVALALTVRLADAQDQPDRDLRDIRVGMPVAGISDAGYADLVCANDPSRKLVQWSEWQKCPADADSLRAIRFGFDAETSREGTLVAGHPVILTALVDGAGMIAGLKVDTDPKARLYIRKKAFLLGVQFKSRYGPEGWTCTQRQPDAGEQPVGGVYLRENCTKSNEGRTLVVQRDLFRLREQDAKSFVSRTQAKITREVN
jgi:hypothetical protein